jgi:hypothetical protein
VAEATRRPPARHRRRKSKGTPNGAQPRKRTP